jgi:hypothetical protein
MNTDLRTDLFLAWYLESVVYNNEPKKTSYTLLSTCVVHNNDILTNA